MVWPPLETGRPRVGGVASLERVWSCSERWVREGGWVACSPWQVAEGPAGWHADHPEHRRTACVRGGRRADGLPTAGWMVGVLAEGPGSNGGGLGGRGRAAASGVRFIGRRSVRVGGVHLGTLGGRWSRGHRRQLEAGAVGSRCQLQEVIISPPLHWSSHTSV